MYHPKTDVVDRPFKLGGQNVICHLGGTYENKSVNIKLIYILSVNIFFLFQENRNIQVIEAYGRGYMVGILKLYLVLLDLRHLSACFCSI